MKKNLLSILAFIMAITMLAGVFASCGGDVTETTSGTTTESKTDNTTESAVSETDEKKTDTSESADGVTDEETDLENSTSPENDTSSETEASTETETATETESQTKDDEVVTDDGGEISPELSEIYGPSILYADSLKNKVTAYYNTDGDRSSVTFENMEMGLDYALPATVEQQVTALKNSAGKSYIENTMDIFVRMNDDSTYYARNSYSNAVFNIYRFGYYYYQMRLEGQNFAPADGAALGEHIVDLSSPSGINDLKVTYRNKTGVLEGKINDTAKDPYFIINQSLNLPADIYTMLDITMKIDNYAANNCDLFFVAGSNAGFSGEQRLSFNVITDNQYHTYRIPIYTGQDYTGTVKGLRLDVNGAGASFEISEVKFVGVDVGSAPKFLSLCRNFNVYSDKMHHVIQVAATEETSGIKEIGMITKIDESTVAKVVVEDAKGIHYSFDGVDWDSVQYVGFDIIDAGIFGYILPYDGKGGRIEVELIDGVYVIEQTMAPENGKIIPSRTDYNEKEGYYNWVSGGNVNDFYMGQRIYTDDNHDFEEFLYEAYCERNPIVKKFKVIDTRSTDASFFGYDSLRGIYRFNMGGAKGGFSGPYYSEPNRHYRTSFYINGDDIDRKIYVMTYTSVGQLESAVLLDENDVMLPVSLEVGKNFSEAQGERNLYNLDDATYGEVIFPLVVEADEKYEYAVINLYQNWGKYPLKQLSWIQFFSPYYHLSTGVTETNCILPWTFTDRVWYNTLPDFRGMSAPHWTDQPQHTSAGEHDWLKYIDAEGNEVRTENILNTIDSYGPTYADVKMDYVTYDGKMKVSYTHTEMPQIDENRTYYEMTYEVLEDITINNFVTDFQIYKVDPNDSTGLYQKVGYLNEKNESVVVAANQTDKPVKYVLGNECPYFSFFDMDNHSDKNGYSNLAFLVYNSEFVIGGEKAEPNFAIVNYKDTVYVTLDIEEKTTLRAGDKFTINAILLPWGSHLLEDGIVDEATNNYEYTMELSDGTLYEDKNVRDVRENTLLKPLKAVAGENAEVIESVFIPKVKSTNGESAEFTLTGGYNNVAVRIYGFKKMTVPVIYEKIGGEWQIYEVSSKNAEKDPHKYDGYCIHYDGDSFSYSFVTDMDGRSDRTFKIVVDGDYEEWKKESLAGGQRTDYLEIYLDPFEMKEEGAVEITANDFAGVFDVLGGVGSEYGDTEFLRLYGFGPDSKFAEGYASFYRPESANKGAGKYLAVKYRIPTENTEKIKTFEFFISTSDDVPSNDCNIQCTKINADGKWHVLILDLEKIASATFKDHMVANNDGKYYPKFIRFDFFDQRMSVESYVDIAFIGMDGSLVNIGAQSLDAKSVTLFEGSSEFAIDPISGNKVTTTPKMPTVLVDPSSGYTLSILEFGAQLDYINGADAILSAGSVSTIGVGKVQLRGSTIGDGGTEESGYKLVVAGWCVVEGGVNRYVWSADGGKTWFDVESFGITPGTAGTTLLDAASGKTNGRIQFTAENDGANGTFQGTDGVNPTGLAFNLEAYKGKTVDVIFGAVPNKDTASILPLFYIGQVTVAD